MVRATHRFLTNDDILNLRPFVAQELASPTGWWVLDEADDHLPPRFRQRHPRPVG
jgi:hypothetical protein